jgi:putative membrane-bound dehydrogenase-like protein
MRCFALASFLVSVAGAWLAGAPSETAKTHQVQLNGHTFTLPVGFEIELAAGPPLVERPIVADFDEQGRLYVADSSGSNEKVQVQLEQKPHRILRLEAADATGRFSRRTVFADKMMFPEGAMWYAGSLYVAAPPSIWKLTDTNGDGVADQRVEWFQGKTVTGCANDLHGPYLGPDGWIYWCKGAFAKQTYDLSPAGGRGVGGEAGRRPFVTRAAHIFRCRPDGSGIEPVMTGGMDNPVDVVFTPGGERIFTTTFFQHPGGGRRDGLVHAIYGGVYGKDHDVIYEHKWTSPALMPVLTHMGAAAPCGLTSYQSRVFGREYQDNLFACQFNMHKVSRHVLEPAGASFKCRDDDFLVSSNLDFHPTDVLEDADGSLLVIDTGGWYKLCCPTSWLHKPDVLGAIYRVRRRDARPIDDPRGLKLAWSKMSAKDLAALLNDRRPAVRRRAIESLGQKGVGALPALEGLLAKAGSGEAFRNAIWAATRIDHADARQTVRRILALDDRELVRQAAIHSASVWRDRDAAPTLIDLLKSPSMHNRRAAAEALGRIGDKSAVSALLAAIGESGESTPGGAPDRALEHSLTYALIEIGDREATAAGLHSANVRTRRAALTALDQMDGGRLEAKTVAAELATADPAMKETAWWIAGRHPEWGGALADVLRDRLAAKSLTPAERDELVRQLARFARSAPVQDFLAERLRDPAAPAEARRTVLRAMAQSGLREAPAAWIAGVTETLTGDDGALLPDAVSTARSLRLPKQRPEKLVDALLKIGNQDKTLAGVRLNALAAVPGGLAQVTPPLFAFLGINLGPDQPVANRSLAADVLARAKLSTEQLGTLAESLKTVGPMELDRLLDAFAQSADEGVGRKLVAALKTSPARSGLRVEALKPRLARFGAPVQKEAEALFVSLDVDAGKQKARLEELLATLKEGDARRGQAVFNGAKAACSSCHAVGYLGGTVGPDLTHIGKIRSQRDLLESIVFPSASFVRSYEPWLVATKDGKVHNGVLRKDAPDEIVLATGANQEVRISREDIEEMQPGKVSVMPSGLDQQLSARELADLVAFLQACK